MQGRLNPVVEIPAVDDIEQGLYLLHALHQRIIIVATKLCRQTVIFGEKRLRIPHAHGDGIKYRHRQIKHGLLIDIGNPYALLHRQQSVVKLDQTGEHFQQGRFASAVTADQTNPLTGLD